MGDGQGRRNLISNATQLIRATRGGRGLIISSEAKVAAACRGPWDAINLAAVWGLGQERGYEAMSKEARAVVVAAQLKRTSYRGVVNVVYGGEKPEKEQQIKSGAETGVVVNGTKRKADALGDGKAGAEEKPLSKTQMKKRAKKEAQEAQARLEAEKPKAVKGSG